MIAPGGHGFLAINLARMLERDTVQFKNYTAEQLEEYVRTQLSDIPAEYKVFDLNFNNHGYQPDNAMDGNIRLICHKTI